MSSPSDKDRPEAGRDTESGKRGEGAHARDGDSGGKRSKAGSSHGDWVPDRGPQPLMGDYYTGGGNIDRIAEEPGTARSKEQPAASDSGSGDDPERVAEANRNKGFDTTHVHTSGSSRKV
ncbi:hypothetical protein [Piscinibacter terrae]|uniref:Uncharacterized protein n=1 Tax=Piscinibacter terrae TaxID=2496871 RepID=A0A3N7HL47_9BURK|nr:hypothetical protein [Albitalea terrae]RQP22838.1 hypothetical protein DZC73_21360 [Albitalea terrae]